MSFSKFPTFTPDSLSNITPGGNINAANHTVPLNNLQDYLLTFDEKNVNAIDSSLSATLTVDDVANFLNNSVGGMTRDLPAANDAGWTQPIFIKKVDSTFNSITLNCPGGTFIEDPLDPMLSPTATSITINNPDEYIAIYPATSSTLRIVNKSPQIKAGASVYLSSSQIIPVGSSPVLLEFDTMFEGRNDFTFFDVVAHRYQPQIPGVYHISFKPLFLGAGGSSDQRAYIYKNGTSGSLIGRDLLTTDSNLGLGVDGDVFLNGSTDYIEFYVETRDNAKTMINGLTGCRAFIHLI